MPRTGRRPGATASRDTILQAARRQFADAGYERTSIRAIAAGAGVDPALVVHFFGSKDRLFQAAVSWPFDPAAVLPRFFAPGPEGLGERLARTFFTFWDDPETRPQLLAVLRSAMTNEDSARLLREFLVTQIFQPLGALVDGPDRELRGELAAAQLVGVSVLRLVLRMEPLASASIDQLVASVGPTLDRYLQPGQA